MFYYLYEIRNKINGKIYVGVHKTNDMNDGYMGSGKIIKSAIKKYGIENFEKTILEIFASSEAMFAREKEVVTDDFLLREDVYNLRRGGTGGFDYINKIATPEQKALGGRNSQLTGKPIHIHKHENYKQILIRAQIARKLSGNGFDTFKGMKHSLESKQKISDSMQGKQVGELNSQHGTMWITDGSCNKKVKKTDQIPAGWRKGRKVNAGLV